MDPDDPTLSDSQRRGFLRQAAALAGAVALGSTEPAVSQAAPAPAAKTAPAPSATGPADDAAPVSGYEYFSPDEAAFVEALVNIMCPADELTPNGVDCGLATFFDRQLAGPFGQGKGRYLRGPWNPGPPQMGLQSPLTPAQFFSEGVRATDDLCRARYGRSFDRLDAASAEALLHELEAGASPDPQSSTVSLADWFNALVYPLFVQACFADPLYGGNHGKVFWRMIGYPGLPATHALDMIKYRGQAYPGAASPRSILDFS